MDDIKIAGKLNLNDWRTTKKTLKSNYNHNWEQAYYFFELRICSRYLKPIHSIIDINKYNGEGFAIVNLQCSLIETIESFLSGIIHRHPNFYLPNKKAFKSNSLIYKSFFKRFKKEFNNIKGEDFYSNVRNSLLHETQTKKNWKIHANSSLPYKKELNYHYLYRNKFQEVIEKILKEYKNCIINGNNFYEIPICDLRENFITKLDHICNES